MKKSIFILLLLFYSCFAAIAQQKTNFILNKEAKRHWENAMFYKKEAKNFSENKLVIEELEQLIKIQEYPEAFLELGKLYGRGYVSSWIYRSEECFQKYAALCPYKKDIAEEEKNKCEMFRKMRKRRFEQKLIGKWSTSPTSFGINTYCFEVNNNGTVTVPYEYSSYLETVIDWQTLNFGYFPDFGKYILNSNSSILGESFKTRSLEESGETINLYTHISFFYQENDENPSDNELIGYINIALNKPF